VNDSVLPFRFSFTHGGHQTVTYYYYHYRTDILT